MTNDNAESVRDRLIAEALAGYGWTDAHWRLIRHNENITCRVEAKGRAYALRIHRPVAGFSFALLEDGQTPAERMESETELLRYLTSRGFPGLQQPVADAAGQYVRVLSDGSPVHALTWVDGEALTRETGLPYARDIGKMSAALCDAAAGFPGKRYQYDETLVDRCAEELCRAEELKHIDPTALDACVHALGVIRAAITRQRNLGDWGIIHADLNFDNILLTPQGLTPIDFSFSGYGCAAQECAMIESACENAEAASRVREGFAQAGKPLTRAETAPFVAFNTLLFLCMQHDRVHGLDWYPQALERWCKTQFLPL